MVINMFANLVIQNEDTEDIHPGDSKSTIPQVIPPHLVESPGAFLLSLLPTGLHEVSGDSCQQILSSLPSPTTAKHLRDIYFAYAAWQYVCIFDVVAIVLRWFYSRQL